MQQQKDETQIIEEPKQWYTGPIKIIVALFLLLIITMWVVSFYAVKIDPEPGRIPKINEVYNYNYKINFSEQRNAITKEDYQKSVKPNDPIIKQTADRIVNIACRDDSEICNSKAIFYFVRDNFQYVPDPNNYEYVKDPKESLSTKNGDCDDVAVLLSSLLGSVGIKTRLVFIPNHVYVEAYLPEASKRYKTNSEDWVSLDATCKSCIFGEIPLTLK